MSSSKIIKGDKSKDRTVTPYTIQDMGVKGRLSAREQACQQAEEILKKARMEKEAIEMQAYNQGISQGQAEGQKVAIKRIGPLFDTFAQAIKELTSFRQQIIEKHQDQLLEILTLIGEKIIHRSIQISPDIVLDTVKAASKHLMETDEIRIRLHPSDYEYIREIEKILSTNLAGRKNVQFIEDNTLERGGVIVETEFGEIDASIRSQIEHIKDKLLEHD